MTEANFKNLIYLSFLMLVMWFVSMSLSNNVYASHGGDCGGATCGDYSCQCCEPHWNPQCIPGWGVTDCNSHSCRCVCGGGGGGGCNPDNWGGCNVSCGWGSQSNECGDSRSCWAGSCCTNANPSSPTLTAPTNGRSLANPAVAMSWTAPSSWGNNCSGNSLYYIVYFGTSATPTTPITCSGQGSVYVPSSTTSCTYQIPTPPATSTGTTYYWRVATYNNGLISYSPTWSLKYVYPAVGIVGGGNASSGLNSAIWDATALGASCAQNDTYKSSHELTINSGDVTYSSSLPNSAVVTVDGTKGTLPTYRIKDVAYGAGTVCIDTSNNNIPAGLSYVLSCTNLQADVNGDGMPDGAGSSSVAIDTDKCALLTSRDVGLKLDLGFKLIPIHWFNSVNGGDVFAGSTDLKVPASEDTTGGFKSYLITGNGFAFGKGALKVEDTGSNTNRISETGGFAQNIDSSFVGQSSFAPPSNATSINNCSSGLTNLDPAQVYQIAGSCLQTYINGNTSYSLARDGVAVVYVTGDATSTVTFGASNKDFKSSGSNRRVLFILNPNVEVSSDLGVVSPTSSSSPNIEAGLVSVGNISFPGKSGGSFANPDTTVIVEGPIVAKGVVQSTRNRYLQNTYPTVVAKFNSGYLKYLKSQEKVSAISNYTGKSSHDVTWVYQPEN